MALASNDLIDTTEMYLKTVFEMEEDGIVPLRARIVERLGHSGPTVSQTIARMERDNLVAVREDRRLELTEQGRKVALEVMRKHRLAERLLVDVIGLDWWQAHEEACRWEHVMSASVESHIESLLNQPSQDPYGNPIPSKDAPAHESGIIEDPQELSLANIVDSSDQGEDGDIGEGGPVEMPTKEYVVTRIGEPIQADIPLMQELSDSAVKPGASVWIQPSGEVVAVAVEQSARSQDLVRVVPPLTSHFFVREA